MVARDVTKLVKLQYSLDTLKDIHALQHEKGGWYTFPASTVIKSTATIKAGRDETKLTCD